MIIFDLLFPITFYSKEDEETLQDNPIEYIRRNEDGFAGNDLKEAALEVVRRYSKHKDQNGTAYIYSILKFINQFLSSGKNPRNEAQALDVISKEALFHMLSSFDITSLNLDKEMEGLLDNYVCGELYNEFPFMKMRACNIIGTFIRTDFSPD